MLILAEGKIRDTPGPDQITAVQAWLGPMVDAGFLQHGYLDVIGHRIWMVLSSPTIAEASQRLDDLPVSRDGTVAFQLTGVTALRFR